MYQVFINILGISKALFIQHIHCTDEYNGPLELSFCLSIISKIILILYKSLMMLNMGNNLPLILIIKVPIVSGEK